jgi:hypothetical protein
MLNLVALDQGDEAQARAVCELGLRLSLAAGDQRVVERTLSRSIGAIAFILGTVALAERPVLVGNYDNVKKEPDQRAVAEEIVSPSRPTGTGGVPRGDRGGCDGSPVSPATPVTRSLRLERLQFLVVNGQSSAMPSSDRTRKSEAWCLGKCALQWMVLPPTALNISGVNVEAAALTG